MAEKNVIRTNISVPRDLKARMDAVGERVNWSAVASEAFIAKLKELESHREVHGMEDVIARLKAADEIDNNETRQEGHQAGVTWAREDARPKQLRNLRRFADLPEGVEYHLGVYCNSANMGIAHGLFLLIRGLADADYGFDPGAARQFWEEVVGDGGAKLIGDRDFAAGFVEGALEVWDAVEDKL